MGLNIKPLLTAMLLAVGLLLATLTTLNLVPGRLGLLPAAHAATGMRYVAPGGTNKGNSCLNLHSALL